jgi:hypothetical protein
VPSELETLKALYVAFNARDIDAILPSLDPSVRWPNGWEGGVVEGRAAVRDYWTRQWSAIDPSVTPQAFEPAADGRIRVTVRQVVRDLGGTVLSDTIVFHTYAFAAGQIRAMEIEPFERG